MAYATINKPSDYFNTLTWTGDGSASRNITGAGFQPDWVWGKCRNTTVSHALYDSVRGASNLINSNTTSAEGTNAALNAFISDGFTVNSDSYFNGNSNTYVAWNWLANGTGVANTDGSISSTVSVNTTAGFSIVSWSGTGSNGTIGHGLGATPGLMIIKNRNDVGSWRVWNSTFNADQYLMLDNADAVATQSILFNSTLPNSSVISAGTSGDINYSGRTYIAYCFAEKKGFSKFGSYTSNNNADGTFVYTGFKPAFLLLKNITTGNTGWELYDNKRTPNNVANLFLRANTNEADNSSDRLDILSNGFKLRQVGDTNYNSDTIIYMAFAAQPLVGTNDVAATAV